MFTRSASAMDRAVAFRDKRLSLIQAGKTISSLAGSGRLVMHVVPTAAFLGFTQLDLEQVRAEGDRLRPIDHASGAYSQRFNYEGSISCDYLASPSSYTQVFRDGCIEAVVSGMVSEGSSGNLVHASYLEACLMQQGLKCIVALQNLGIPPPLVVMISLLGVDDAKYSVETSSRFSGFRGNGQPFPAADVMLPPCVLEDYADQTAYHQALRPAIDALWNSAGLAKAAWFNAEGMWVPPRQS